MGRTKHNTTGNGTHRQRIYKYRQNLAAMRKLMKLMEEMKAKGLNLDGTPIQHEAADMDVTINGDLNVPNYIVGMDPASPEGGFMSVALPPAEPSDKDDGLGHAFEDENLQDTMREFNGMVNNDKHEQLMDTFVEATNGEEKQ